MKMMCVSLTTLLIITLQHVRSEVLSDSFEITKVTETNYGRPLNAFDCQSLMECFLECQRSAECQSAVYDKSSRLCKTNAIAVRPSTLQGSIGPGVQMYSYGGKVAETLTTMRMPCTTNDHCVDTRSECRDGIFKCYYGYAHNSATYSCVKSCSVSGSTFQKEMGRYISGYNDEIINSSNEADCETRCLQVPTCRTYEFEYSTHTCLLQSVTSLTSISYSSDYNLQGTVHDCICILCCV